MGSISGYLLIPVEKTYQREELSDAAQYLLVAAQTLIVNLFSSPARVLMVNRQEKQILNLDGSSYSLSHLPNVANWKGFPLAYSRLE